MYKDCLDKCILTTLLQCGDQALILSPNNGKERSMTGEKQTITARGKVQPMGASQFNVLEEDTDRYLAEFTAAGCDIRAEWAGKKPLLVTISRKEGVPNFMLAMRSSTS